MIHFDPSEISSWANRPDANHQLPELVRRLILATVPELPRLDMPSGSAVWGVRLGWTTHGGDREYLGAEG